MALIEDGVPVEGWVYAPVPDVLYTGIAGKGAWRYGNAMISGTDASKAERLPIASFKERPFTIVASRSHLNDETADFIDKLQQEHKDAVLKSAGSSLKLCMVAEGSADVYPRFAPTMEWDTAAADAVCRAAGCSVFSWSKETKRPDRDLQYNKENMLNPWFIVQG